MKRKNPVIAIFMLFTFSLLAFAQNPTVDEGFVPAVSRVSSTVSVATVIQPDGKIIAFGKFNVVNGIARSNVVRLNSDGTTDPTFDCPACNFLVASAFIQPDGKILVGGREGNPETPYEKIIRVNSDGSLDTSFNYTRIFSSGTLLIKGVQSDGKILVKKTILGDQIYRLNADGSKDNSFVIAGGNRIEIKVLADGRIFLYGETLYGYLALLNENGSKNNSFESPALTWGSNVPYIEELELQSDGKFIIYGAFTTVNGLNRKGIARLNADQSVDKGFIPPDFALPNVGDGWIFSLSGNKVLVGNSTLTTPGRIFRLNDDGSLDNTFTVPGGIASILSLQIDSSERIYAFINPANLKLVRYNADGTLDTSFNPTFEIAGAVYALGLQSDGKILAGGLFQKTSGLNRRSVSRFNSDGTTDPSFDTGEKFAETASIFDFGVQSDGKILVGGNFVYDGNGKRLVRLNSDGSLDSPFNVNITGTTSFDTIVYDVALQSDGKIIIGGVFENVNSTARTALARLNSDGTLDTLFNVQLGAGARVYEAIVQPDGKIMIAGTFSGVNGFNRANLARLNSDGTLDASFNSTESSIKDLEIQPDGKYLVMRSNTVVRLNADGSVDNSFSSPALNGGGTLSAFALLNDGSIVISGVFTTVDGFSKNYLARLGSDGEVDGLTFVKWTDAEVKVFLNQPDGKLLSGGIFKVIEDQPRTGLARLSFNPNIVSAPFDFDGDGRTDISVFRPSSNVWYQLLGANYQFNQRVYGQNGDKIVPADYDGDGKTDFAVFRPSNGNWYYILSAGNLAHTIHWGQAGDIPLPSDVDGDGRDDFIVYRPSSSNWFRLTTGGQFTEIVFGTTGDKPLIGDFDGDGKADPAIYRPSNGQWWYAASSAGNEFRAVHWGIAEDIAVPADYDGDGKTDNAVYRPSSGVWYILNSGNQSATIIQFGLSADKPVAGDYDGDGKADIAVYRPSTGEWYILRSSAGFFGLQFGISEDIPIPNAFIQ